MAKLLFVVHRYAPFPGGSEIYVQSMAEESLRRGHEVTVFAGMHQGDLNGVSVTNNPAILLAPWDLIIVHGGDVNVQNLVLTNISRIPSPVLYLLILPSESQACMKGLNDCSLIGYSTHEDLEHCIKHNVKHKAIKIRHGIQKDNCLGKPGFKSKYNISKKMFLSSGGYWPNKAMKELAHLFELAGLKDSVLVTTGYDNRNNIMPEKTSSVIPLILDDRQDVLDAMIEAEAVIMHSYTEGFGLVLLESMLNKTPWIARNIAGAKLMKNYGYTYECDEQLISILKSYNKATLNTGINYNYVLHNHLISNTIDDIEQAALTAYKSN